MFSTEEKRKDYRSLYIPEDQPVTQKLQYDLRVIKKKLEDIENDFILLISEQYKMKTKIDHYEAREKELSQIGEN